jgi:uncharacterized membrane protein YgaE (UPF0421/DUF939 family)
MHDIKYFFLNKNNQTIQRETKNFQRWTDYRKHYLKILFFQNPEGAVAPYNT